MRYVRVYNTKVRAAVIPTDICNYVARTVSFGNVSEGKLYMGLQALMCAISETDN
jgi:hypothetical protein